MDSMDSMDTQEKLSRRPLLKSGYYRKLGKNFDFTHEIELKPNVVLSL